MRFFRATCLSRSTISSLILGLVLAVLSGNARAQDRSFDYSSWLSLHLPESAPESVQNALERANDAGAHSLDDFLEAFLEEISRTGSDKEAAEWLYGKSVNHSVLRYDLRLRLLDVVATTVLPRSLETAPFASAQSVKKRFGPDYSSVEDVTDERHNGAGTRDLIRSADFVAPRFTVSQEQPQGP